MARLAAPGLTSSAREQVLAALAEAEAEALVDLELVLAPDEALPTELVALTELASLRLVCPAPLTLPPWFVRLRGLSWLEVDGCLEAIPANLAELDTLEHLRLRCRGGFDPVLAALPHLRELELELDELGEVPLTFVDRGCLESVSIRARTLSRVPLGLLAAPRLRCLTLDIETSPLAPAMPRVVPGLDQLELLAISGWPLVEFPVFVTELGTLTSLTLRRCGLRQLPDHWGALACLEHLDVSDNEIEQLPESLGDLPALRSLVAVGNPIAVVDPAINGLQRLDLGA